MRTPPPLPPDLETLLAPHRQVLPLAPSVEARVRARAAAAASLPRAGRPERASSASRWALAVGLGAIVAAGAAAGAFAARGWLGRDQEAGVVCPAPEVPARAARLAAALEAPPDTSVEPPAGRIGARRHAQRVAPSNAELRLLERARGALVRRDFGQALSAVAEHARRFRRGILIEEREALRVRALEGLGRQDDARRAAAAFRARFPLSALL
jgi:hypothetical protein